MRLDHFELEYRTEMKDGERAFTHQPHHYPHYKHKIPRVFLN